MVVHVYRHETNKGTLQLSKTKVLGADGRHFTTLRYDHCMSGHPDNGIKEVSFQEFSDYLRKKVFYLTPELNEAKNVIGMLGQYMELV